MHFFLHFAPISIIIKVKFGTFPADFGQFLEF